MFRRKLFTGKEVDLTIEEAKQLQKELNIYFATLANDVIFPSCNQITDVVGDTVFTVDFPPSCPKPILYKRSNLN